MSPALPVGGGADVGAVEPRKTDAARAPVPAAFRPDPVRVSPDGPAGPPPAAPERLHGYVWPLPGARLTLPFEHSRWGSRLVEGRPFHDGVDMATFCGDRIYAAHAGRVLAAGRRFDDVIGWRGDLRPYYARLDEKGLWGTLPIALVIDDGNGYRSIYAHFRKVVVVAGQRVAAGQLIGYEGDTGRASGCHLHYGLFSPAETAMFELKPDVVAKLLVPRYQTARINPLDVLPTPPLRGSWPAPDRPSPGGDTAGR